ncbi:hypothetical protein [Streptomyces sp. NPDC017964]|uniref:hypothetical protein n=1 Tax=Streptomyces sp. NPDC017964 TaxID=3365022 RepID=UPI00378860E5
MLNPTHRVLRNAGIFLRKHKWSLSTAAQVCQQFGHLSRWADSERMPTDLQLWSVEEWQAFIDHRRSVAEPRTVENAVQAIRKLILFSGVVTGVGHLPDPWPGRSDRDVAESAQDGELSTESIAPEVWWPLLRAAWAYIDRFAPDILAERDRQQHGPSEDAEILGQRPPRKARRTSGEIDQQLTEWLADPQNVVPVSDGVAANNPAGAPVWSVLSRIVTAGGTSDIFMLSIGPRGTERRNLVLKTTQDPTRTRAVNPLRGVDGDVPVARERLRDQEDVDAVLRTWLADPANQIPVHGAACNRGAAGEPIWSLLERTVYGNSSGLGNFTLRKSGKRRTLLNLGSSSFLLMRLRL